MNIKKNASLFWFCICIQLIVGISLCVFFVRKNHTETGPVTTLAIRCESIFSLPQDILQSMLALTDAEKANLGEIDLKEVQKRLLSHPALLEARVRKLHPGTLIVDYSLRQPLCIVGEMGVDKEGGLFPLNPYYPALSLPKIFFPSTEDIVTFLQQEKELFTRTVRTVEALSELGQHVEEVDLSDAIALGIFRREIRIRTKEELIFRLPVQDTEKAIHKFHCAYKKYPKYRGIVDIRFPGVVCFDQFFENTIVDSSVLPKNEKKSCL